MHTRTGSTIAAIGLLTLAFSGTASAAQGGPLSKKNYIKAADNICRQANELRAEASSTDFADVPAGGQPTLDQMTTYVADVDPIDRQQLDSLRALPASSSEKKKVKKVYKLFEKAFDAIVADPGLLLGTSDPFAKADKAAQQYGFKVCGASGA